MARQNTGSFCARILLSQILVTFLHQPYLTFQQQAHAITCETLPKSISKRGHASSVSLRPPLNGTASHCTVHSHTYDGSANFSEKVATTMASMKTSSVPSEEMPKMVKSRSKKAFSNFLSATSRGAFCNDSSTLLVESAGHDNQRIYYLRFYTSREAATNRRSLLHDDACGGGLSHKSSHFQLRDVRWL